MINTKYKDRLFTFIFGNAERKEWTLSLYNAVNGSSYTNPDDIMFMTMDDVLYMGMKNDLSFLVTDLANMYEQQSTYNPNMPDDSELKELLIANKAEVKQMCITEYNEAETMEKFKDEGRAEGRAEGRTETIFSCVYENDFTEQRGAQKLNLSIEQFREKYNHWLKMKKN